MGLLSRSIRVYEERTGAEHILRNGDMLTISGSVTMSDTDGKAFVRYEVVFNLRNEKGRLVLERKVGFRSANGEGVGAPGLIHLGSRSSRDLSTTEE